MSKKPLLLIIGLAGIFLLGCFLMSGCGGGGGDSSVGGPPAEPPTDQEVEEITDEQAQEILDTLSDGDSYYNDLVGQGDPSALQKTVDWLKTQPNIEDAAVGEDCVSICIKYDSGVEGIILTESFRSLGEIEAFQAGSEQYLQLKNDLSSTSTTNKKALILLPIDSVPEYKDESVDEIEAYLQQSGFSVEIYRDEDVTVDLMKTVSNYPFVYMATHGCVGLIGSEVMTGEVANTNTIALFWNLLKAGRTSGLTIVMPAETDKIYFGLNENFFDDYVYPSTFVYMNACNSFKNDSLADAFLNNGASVYIGWDNTSFLALSNSHNPEFFQELLKQNNTLMQAYNDTIANYYPAIVYKDDNDNGEYHVLLLNGQHAGDEDDTTVDYSLALKYKGNSEYVLHGPDTLYLNSSLNDQEFTDGQTTKYYSFTLDEQSNVAILSAGPLDLKGSLRDADGNPKEDHEGNYVASGYTDIGSCVCLEGGRKQTYNGHAQDNFMFRADLEPGTYTLEVSPEDENSLTQGEFSIVLLKRPANSEEFFVGMEALLGDEDSANDYLDIYVKALYPEYYKTLESLESLKSESSYAETNYCCQSVCAERQCKALTKFYLGVILGRTTPTMYTNGYIAEEWSTFDDSDNNCIADYDYILQGDADLIYHSTDTFGTTNCDSGDYFYDPDQGAVFRGTSYKLSDFIKKGDIFVQDMGNHYGLIYNSTTVLDANFTGPGRLAKVNITNRDTNSWKVVRPQGSLSYTSPPSVPTGLTGTAVSSSQIDLSWNASTDDVGVEGYNIYRDGVYLKSVTTSFASDTGLNPSTEYCYTVSAYDAAGNESGQSSGACATTSSLTNTPPTATITSPSDSDGDTFTEGDEITFTGTGIAPEDGELTGDYLVWTSDNNGEIGTGTSFTTSILSVDTHTITLTATDYDGATDTDSITITITTSYPYPWTQAIVDKYLELGGSDGVLGSPISDEQTGDSSFTGTICTYINFENGTIEYHTNGNYEGQVFTIINPLFEKWASLGYGTSDLGYPISDISDIETSIYGTQFQYQNFEGGSLEYHLSGGYAGQVFEIHGEIFNKWKSMGYAQSVLGLVTSDEREATQSGAEGFSTTGRVNDFEGGHIHWHRDGTYAGQAFESHGDIDELYVSMGGTGSWLGFPTSDEYSWSEGARSSFEGGYIYWTEAEGATAYPYSTDESPWPMFQHDVWHTGLSAYTGTATGTPTSTPKWTVSLSNGNPTSPVISSDGSIYIGTGSGKLYKVNPAGSVNLFYDTQTNGTVQTPALASDGTIYIIDNYSLYALFSDGQLKWEYPFGDGTDGPSPPAIASDGTIYIGSNRYLYAFNPNGELVWQSSMLSNGRWVKSPALASEGTIYTVGKIASDVGNRFVYALNSQNGTILWKSASSTFSTVPTLSDDGTILVGGAYGLYAINSSDGSQKWHSNIGSISGSTPAVGSNGIIYVGSQDYLLYAINSEGVSQWPYATVNTQDKIIASPIIDAAGTIYIGSTSKMFYAINPNGTVKWQAQLTDKINCEAVIGSDGTVYVASCDGNLYAFGE